MALRLEIWHDNWKKTEFLFIKIYNYAKETNLSKFGCHGGWQI